jgi:hypothetical protein
MGPVRQNSMLELLTIPPRAINEASAAHVRLRPTAISSH